MTTSKRKKEEKCEIEGKGKKIQERSQYSWQVGKRPSLVQASGPSLSAERKDKGE